MDEPIKLKANEILSLGILKILKNYTDYALLINACFVSSTRYETLLDTNGLSTTRNIPAPLRLDQEIDFQYTNAELKDKYQSDILNVVFRNYLVMSISLVDAVLEELYELFLTSIEVDISNDEINKKIRSAWANDNILSYFVAETKVNLKKPVDMQTPFEESFMRYKELRIIRHSLVHSNGIISQNNLNLLTVYLDMTPEERKDFAIINSPIIDSGNQVALSINTILSIRQYLYRFLIYMCKSVNNA